MNKIENQLLSSVIRIGRKTIQETEEFVWFGIGVLIRDNRHPHHFFAVTNKHVIANEPSVLLNFTANDPLQQKHISVDLIKNGKDQWIGHPNAAIDIGIIPINKKKITDKEIMLAAISTEEFIGTKEMYSLNVSEGDDVFMTSLFLDIGPNEDLFPYVRKGSISQIQPLLKKIVNYFVIDILVMSGNSGSPVFLKVEAGKTAPKIKLIGVARGYRSYSDQAYSVQSNQLRVIFVDNFGLSYVEHTDSIMDILDNFKG